MEKSWNFIWDNFFCEKTNLLYDYLVRNIDGNILTDHLPSVNEINRQIPNACGWGTGMEDSVLSAGSMIDAIVARYNVTRDKNMKPFADKVFDGMMRCVVDFENGFISRSVSPADEKSFYYDTSRDQFTHWVYGGLRLYNSELADAEQKENIKKVIVAVAKRMERNCLPSNDYNFLRYDGETSIAGKMWGVLGAHEYMRLPFFYIAAWYVSGDNHWYDLYMQYRDEAFKKQSKFNALSYGLRCYPVLQMQYSLRAIYDIDPDYEFRAKCLEFMQSVADYYKTFAVSESKRICDEIGEEHYYYQYKPWNKVRMLYQGIIGNRPYFNPAQSEMSENRGFYHIRNVGEAVSILALCPDFKIGEEQFAALQNLNDAIDYDRICNYSPMLLVCGWWLLKEANLFNN
ncbi:MAG: hypothetical protein J6S13_04010 [Clostridia bacterium]|nr:hypothetical protein [Clostridia bacterium]